jgi:hypothetical protein
MLFNSLRRKARWLRGRRCVPPPPSPVRFPVKSLRQLGFFVAHKRRNFYVLYPERGQPVPLSIWRGRKGVVVCPEAGSERWFVPFAQGDASFLGAAIRQGRLYVLWDV